MSAVAKPYSGFRLSVDSDLLRWYPDLDRIWPRFAKDGTPKNNWDVDHQLAVDEITRRLKAGKEAAEVFDITRLSIRSQERLRDPAANFALYFIFFKADTQGDATGFFARKSREFYTRASEMFEDETIQLDYDTDNSGTIEESEKNQPFAPKFIRG